MSRSSLTLQLDLQPQPIARALPHRSVEEGDVAALAHLLLDAYRGTIDDGGETPEDAQAEVEALFGGKYGPLLSASSFVLPGDNGIICACLTTLWQNTPFVPYVMTARQHANHGYARYLLQHSINALQRQGYRTLTLVVTDGNANAQHLYTSLGFQPI